eukprot:2327990-Ditylum_brightwellii.AAC.1
MAIERLNSLLKEDHKSTAAALSRIEWELETEWTERQESEEFLLEKDRTIQALKTFAQNPENKISTQHA